MERSAAWFADLLARPGFVAAEVSLSDGTPLISSTCASVMRSKNSRP